jgi:hypothetical protein
VERTDVEGRRRRRRRKVSSTGEGREVEEGGE